MADLKTEFSQRVQQYGCKNEDLAVNYFTRLNNEIKKLNPPKLWNQINFEDFLQKSIAYANIGIDPLAPKMLSFTLFSNKSNGLFDVVFVEDVRCMELLARRYGVNCPESVRVELIYSNDNEFSIIKKSLSNPSEGYEFGKINHFDRGEVIGGVSLTEYANPTYNKVRVLSLKEIEKRVNTNSPFWKNWKEEMCEKTVAKNAWSKVVLDTTQLSEFYAAKGNDPVEYEPENTEELPFDPYAEL